MPTAARSRFRPKVFAAGKYTLRVMDPEAERTKEIRDLRATAENAERLVVDLQS
ncbi:MAG TPA: hypothetical protein VHZ24_14155 [Pirellulales bacterium]|jgi:hypothetical protein|nr:hypothetical protein [Pirellulales bacterium]